MYFCITYTYLNELFAIKVIISKGTINIFTFNKNRPKYTLYANPNVDILKNAHIYTSIKVNMSA